MPSVKENFSRKAPESRSTAGGHAASSALRDHRIPAPPNPPDDQPTVPSTSRFRRFRTSRRAKSAHDSRASGWRARPNQPARLPDARGTPPRVPNRDHLERPGSAQVDDQELPVSPTPMVTRCEVFFEVADRRIGREVRELRSKPAEPCDPLRHHDGLGTNVRWLANPQRHAD